MPDAALVVGATGLLVIKPPGYLVVIGLPLSYRTLHEWHEGLYVHNTAALAATSLRGKLITFFANRKPLSTFLGCYTVKERKVYHILSHCDRKIPKRCAGTSVSAATIKCAVTPCRHIYGARRSSVRRTAAAAG